jgi:hypothetical protein
MPSTNIHRLYFPPEYIPSISQTVPPHPQVCKSIVEITMNSPRSTHAGVNLKWKRGKSYKDGDKESERQGNQHSIVEFD